MRSGELKAEAVASTGRDRSNTSLAAPSSCESRTPTATGAAGSPANPRSGDAPINVKTAKAASRPIRAIPLPLGAAPSPYRANTAAAQLLVPTAPRSRLVGAAVPARKKMSQLNSL